MDNKPCPFCGSVPKFEGTPRSMESNRYFEYDLPCGCHNLTVYAGNWPAYQDCPEEEWPTKAAAIATDRWNTSFVGVPVEESLEDKDYADLIQDLKDLRFRTRCVERELDVRDAKTWTQPAAETLGFGAPAEQVVDRVAGCIYTLTPMNTRRFAWDPREDITAYELAMTLPLFASQHTDHRTFGLMYDGLPDEIKRHWLVTGGDQPTEQHE